MLDFLTKAKSIAADARSTIAEIKTELETQKNKREELLKEKDKLFLQPLSKADIKQVISDYIDNKAAMYIEMGGITNIVNSIAFPSRPPQSSLPTASNKAVNLYELDEGFKSNGTFVESIFGFGNLPIFNGHALAHGDKRDLCFFFGDVIKQKIEAHFDAFFPADWDSYKPGLPLAERRLLIADLDSEIANANKVINECESHLRSLSSSAKA